MGNNRSKGGRDATCKLEDETLKEVEEEVAEWSRTIQRIKGNQGAKMDESDLIHRMNTTAKNITCYISNVDEDQTGQAGLYLNVNGPVNPTSSSKRTQNEDGTCSGQDREEEISRKRENIQDLHAENDQLKICGNARALHALNEIQTTYNTPEFMFELLPQNTYETWVNMGFRRVLWSAYTFCVINSNELVTKMEAVTEELFEDIRRREHSLTLPQSPHGRETNPLLALEDYFFERHWKPKQRKEAQKNWNKQTSVRPTNMGQELIKMRKGVAV
ncbi:hypothetical protein MAR_023743 [Mya arenaria]|uniref:Uncharacterized protein n=1 Tax=Mya arenaria TaxID=6604 RepID=A0ABY7DSP3_MYAAR|nr:hypothetical protein MAR_023743 [Mya arenaria]